MTAAAMREIRERDFVCIGLLGERYGERCGEREND